MIDQFAGAAAIEALEARGIPMPDLSLCNRRPVVAALKDMIELLHKSDDYMMEIEDGIPNEVIVTLLRTNLDNAYKNATKLLAMQKTINNKTCPECGSTIEGRVCQGASCKGGLL